MVLALGTNSGFVLIAPTIDPAAAGNYAQDNVSSVTRDTSPITAGKITEIGWWCDTASEEANFEVGLYAADGAVVPGEAGTRLYVSSTSAKGTDAGWKKITGLNWAINPNTVYWIAVACANTTTQTSVNLETSGGSGIDRKTSTPSLPAPFDGGAILDTDGMFAIYAVWDVVAGEEYELYVSETLGLTDYTTNDSTLNKDELLAITDSSVGGYAVTETLTLSDSICNSVIMNKMENLTTVDSVYKLPIVNIFESLTLSDSIITTIVYILNLTEIVILSDSVYKGIGLSKSETLTTVDSLYTVWMAIRELAETIAITDNVGKSSGICVNENVSLVDSLYKTYGLNSTETLNISDSKILNIVKNISETITANDTLMNALTIYPFETLNLLDSVYKLASINTAENLTISDSLDVTRAILSYLTENLNIADSYESLLATILYLTETLTISDRLKPFPRYINKLINTNQIFLDDVSDSFDVSNKIILDDVTKDSDVA